MRFRIAGWGLALVVIAAGAWFGWRHGLSNTGAAVESESESTAAANEPATTVTLTSAKLQAAGLTFDTAGSHTLGEMMTVPGRVQYDDRRHVELKTATAGVLVEVRVKPGDEVAAGAIVAVVSSPELGQARADVLEREANLQIAQTLRDWRQSACEGLERLAAAVKSTASLEDIRRDFQGVQLGSAREQILGAYAKYTLALSLAASLQSASQVGSVPGRTLQEALSSRDASAALFDSVVEQSLFDARQQCQTAKNDAADAERRLQIARQHLRTLLGYVGEMPAQSADLDPQGNLSLVEVRAPFAGTIERQMYSAAERVQQGDSLFVLADTSKLWIAADLREREWTASRLSPGDALTVSFPALPGQEFSAQVYFVGREVDTATNALPLMAVIDNADGRLRPGLFAQITVPVGPSRSVLAVPDGAVCEHQGTRFVFLKTGESTFRRVNIESGLHQGGWTEVRSGLQPGDTVVVAGAFALKSELLLEREEE